MEWAETVAIAIYCIIIGVALLAIIIGFVGKIKGIPNHRVDDANEINDNESLDDITLANVVNAAKRGDVKIPWFTVGVLLSRASDAKAKKRKNEKELMKTQQQILAELKKKK